MMFDVAQVPLWVAIVAASFIVLGAGLTLIGTVGLVRIGLFLQTHPCAHARHQLGHRRQADGIDDPVHRRRGASRIS